MAASIDNFCKLVVGLRYLILLLTQSKRFYVPSRTPCDNVLPVLIETQRISAGFSNQKFQTLFNQNL